MALLAAERLVLSFLGETISLDPHHHRCPHAPRGTPPRPHLSRPEPESHPTRRGQREVVRPVAPGRLFRGHRP